MVGRAKSSIVKVLTAYTVGLFGGSAVILDVKGEHAQLAALLGYAPVRLRPNDGTRLNLLDGPVESLPQVLAGIGRSTLGHPLNPVELAALPAALSTAAGSAGAGVLHLGHVAEALLFPESAQAEALGYQGPRALGGAAGRHPTAGPRGAAPGDHRPARCGRRSDVAVAARRPAARAGHLRGR